MSTHRARVVGFVVAVVALTMLAAPGFAHANAVTQWNQNATNALIDTAGQPPTVSVLHLAMVQGAVYDAVNAIDRGYRPYLVSPRAKRWDSTDAAAATAAYRVLVSIVPAQQPALRTLYESSLSAIPDGRSKAGGIAAGEAAAAAMIAARTNDGRFGPFRFSTGTLPGEWRPVLPSFISDPTAWVKDVKPFLIRSSSQFRSRGPNALTSHKYAREFVEVKSLGSATSTTTDARPDARGSVLGGAAAADVEPHPPHDCSARGPLQLRQRAALCDGLPDWCRCIHHRLGRQGVLVLLATDHGDPRGGHRRQCGNRPGPAWLPLIATPPYPEHPSGHLGLSGSVVATLQSFFRTDKIAWTDTNNAGLTRSYSRLSQALREIVSARVWSGLHFRTADEQSVRIARQVAEWREHHYFQPLHHHHHHHRLMPDRRVRSCSCACRNA